MSIKKGVKNSVFTPLYLLNYSKSLHLTRHFIRQAVDVRSIAKNARSAPVIIAPIMLVAAKVTPKRTIDSKTVPKMPVIRTVIVGHRQLRLDSQLQDKDVDSKSTAR